MEGTLSRARALAAAVALVATLPVACREANDPIGVAAGDLLTKAAHEESDDDDVLVGALAALGAPVVPHLARALTDPNQNTRLVAVDALAKIGGDAAAGTLVGALGDPSDTVRLEVVKKLGEMRTRKAVTPLLERYKADDDDQVRYECLTSLGLIGDPAASDLLVRETRSRDPYARMWAMDALCAMKDEHAAPLGLELLRDDNKYVRAQVVRSCAEAFRSAEGRRALVEFALSSPEFDATVWARRNLANYVKSGGDAVANEIRQAALAELQGPRSLRAALLLGDLADPAATDRLIEALHDPDGWVRHHAAFLLARIGDPRAVPPLAAALEDKVELVAVTAYTSLQAFADKGDERAKKALDGYKGRRPTERVEH